jgi:hypothetical protein
LRKAKNSRNALTLMFGLVMRHCRSDLHFDAASPIWHIRLARHGFLGQKGLCIATEYAHACARSEDKREVLTDKIQTSEECRLRATCNCLHRHRFGRRARRGTVRRIGPTVSNVCSQMRSRSSMHFSTWSPGTSVLIPSWPSV